MKSSPPPSGRYRRPRHKIRSNAERPQLTVSSVASWWCGIQRDDDNIELGFVAELVGIDVDKDRLRFVTTHDRRLELEVAAYPDSLPVAIGRAVVQYCTAAWHFRVLESEMYVVCADQKDLIEVLAPDQKR